MSGANCVGAISQLVAQGQINKYLNTDPNITFFRYQHMKHTNFAIENQRLEFEGGSNSIAAGQSSSVRLHRSGDLVYGLYCLIDLPGLANVRERSPGAGLEEAVDASEGASYTGQSVTGKCPYWTNAVGQYLVKEASVFIGSQPIDTLYNDYLFMYEELTGKPGRRLLEMIGKQTTRPMACHRTRFFRRLYVPLPFFFTKTSGNALPLVSLQFHDVRIRIAWNGVATAICDRDAEGFTTVIRPGQASLEDSRGSSELYQFGASDAMTGQTRITDSAVRAQIEAQYIYLDVMERAKFAEGSFEMLMDEVQALPAAVADKEQLEIDVNFNHAVIELLWACRQQKNAEACDHFNYAGVQEPFTGATMDAVQSVDLRLNNQCRFEETEGRYFRLVQPYQHHTNIPQHFVYSYSFALHPEDAQPSGSCNFSRIDNAKLRLRLDSAMFQQGARCDVLVFARNWNVLRVTLGLAGKAYAN